MSNPPTDPGTPALTLTGLDGTNPLAFLAALGLLRLMDAGSCESQPRPRLAWIAAVGTYVPQLTQVAHEPAALLDRLQPLLIADIAQHPARHIEAFAELDQAERRARLAALASDPHRRDEADWLAAIASDAAPADATNQLQTARRDYFAGNIRSVVEKTQRLHLDRALFHTWDYADPLDNRSLHLDPSEDRRHAYQWNKPAGDPNRKKHGGMLGANRLALEAFPLFTSVPEHDTLRTLGFTGHRSDNTRWTWPLWQPPLDLATCRSLLAHPGLQRAQPDPNLARELGLLAVVRSRRILVGKTPNLTPAQRIA